MTRRTLVRALPGSPTSTPPADAPAPVVTPAQLRALAAAIEQLADAIDVVTDEATPSTYADEHVRVAREQLRTVWDG